MFGKWFIFVLAGSGIVVQGNRNSNANVNSNSNVFYGRRQFQDSGEPIVSLENTRRKLYNENDVKTASIATAAGDAALTITQTLIDDLGKTVSTAVAECIAKILKRHSSITAYRRSTLPITLSGVNETSTGSDVKLDLSEDVDDVTDIPTEVSESIDVEEKEENEESKSRRRWDRIIPSEDYLDDSNMNANVNSNTNINTNSYRRYASSGNTENRPHKSLQMIGASRRWGNRHQRER